MNDQQYVTLQDMVGIVDKLLAHAGLAKYRGHFTRVAALKADGEMALCRIGCGCGLRVPLAVSGIEQLQNPRPKEMRGLLQTRIAGAVAALRDKGCTYSEAGSVRRA